MAEIYLFPARHIRRRPGAAVLDRDLELFRSHARQEMRTALLGGLCAGFAATCFLGVSTAFLSAGLPITSPILGGFGLVMLAFAFGFFSWAHHEYRVYRQQLGEYRALSIGANQRRRA